MVVQAMTPESESFGKLPEQYQKLALAAYQKGFCDFWYHPDYGLFADAPNATLEDDRVPLSWALLRQYKDR